MKGSCLISRRSGITREEFRDYYENQHAPLGMCYFPFRKYLRNHVLTSSADIDFDVIMESYFDDGVDVAAINSGDVRRIMDIDERRFMDQKLIRSARVKEQLLSGSPVGIAPAGTFRLMLLLRADGSADGIFQEKTRNWGHELGKQSSIAHVSLDIAQHQVSGYGGFPYDAILSLWLRDKDANIPLEAPEGITLSVSVLTEVYETRPEDLQGRFGSRTPLPLRP